VEERAAVPEATPPERTVAEPQQTERLQDHNTKFHVGFGVYVADRQSFTENIPFWR
jgi:hypothetical protein